LSANQQGNAMAKDLRTHLKSLRTALPAQWAQVSKTVDSNIDLCAIVQNLENEGRYPTIAFRMKGLWRNSGPPSSRSSRLMPCLTTPAVRNMTDGLADAKM
jgi:hypothetical protein